MLALSLKQVLFLRTPLESKLPLLLKFCKAFWQNFLHFDVCRWSAVELWDG